MTTPNLRKITAKVTSYPDIFALQLSALTQSGTPNNLILNMDKTLDWFLPASGPVILDSVPISVDFTSYESDDLLSIRLNSTGGPQTKGGIVIKTTRHPIVPVLNEIESNEVIFHELNLVGYNGFAVLSMEFEIVSNWYKEKEIGGVKQSSVVPLTYTGTGTGNVVHVYLEQTAIPTRPAPSPYFKVELSIPMGFLNDPIPIILCVSDLQDNGAYLKIGKIQMR